MELMREGASPLSSEAALSFVLRVLSRKDVAGTLLDAEAVVLAHKLVAFQPRHHLADTYLEQSLMGGAPRAFFTLDATEFHYLDHMTDGSWATRVGFCSCIDAMKNDWLVGVVADENDVHTFVWTDDSVPAARMAAKDASFAQVLLPFLRSCWRSRDSCPLSRLPSGARSAWKTTSRQLTRRPRSE